MRSGVLRSTQHTEEGGLAQFRRAVPLSPVGFLFGNLCLRILQGKAQFLIASLFSGERSTVPPNGFFFRSPAEAQLQPQDMQL